MPPVNDPAVLSEIAALHDRYERALADHDVAALQDFFWDSPEVVRYGVNEHLYGADAITAYRQNTVAPPFTDRRLLRRAITTYGPDTASVMCELSQLVAGQPRHSRQSQTWIRFPDVGWKIVAAHVSNALLAPPSTAAWDAYADQAAAALGLPISPAHRPGVVQNLQRAAAIAAPLLAFTFPSEVEPAPVFTP
jgi:hypothetical protein